ncbi:hypothetical protein pb186bvf_000467 [Paramecium bursaria]
MDFIQIKQLTINDFNIVKEYLKIDEKQFKGILQYNPIELLQNQLIKYYYATKGDNLLALCWVYEEPKFYRNGNSVGRINFRILEETDGLKEKFIQEMPKSQNVYKYLAFDKIEGFEKLGVQMTYK